MTIIIPGFSVADAFPGECWRKSVQLYVNDRPILALGEQYDAAKGDPTRHRVILADALRSLGLSFDVVPLRNSNEGPAITDEETYRALVWGELLGIKSM